jgi:hypothetical protein
MQDRDCALEHLDVETRQQMHAPADERLARLLDFRFCNYPAADLVLDKLEVLFYDDAPGHQLGLAVFGAPGLGKSYLLRHFAENLHPSYRTPERGTHVRPVVYLALSSEFTLRELQAQVLAGMGALNHGWRYEHRDLHLKRLAADLNVRVFIFDDIQHFTNQGRVRCGRLFDWLKYLLNDLGIVVVIAGIPEAADAVAVDTQISTRFDVVTLPQWQRGAAFGQFLGNFERTFPLRFASHLEDPDMQECILGASGGVTRIMVQQLVDAAIFAIDHDIERIEPALLTVRATRPKELAAAFKRGLITYRRLKAGGLAAAASAPEGRFPIQNASPEAS